MSNEVESTIEMIENYHKKGGDYIIPVEVVNDIKNLIIELEKEKNNIFDTGIKECLRIRDMKDKEIERLNNIIKEQEIEDKPNYYVKGLEGSLKEYQEEVKRLNNIIKSARDLFYEKCRISQNGVYTFNQVDYEELENELKGSDK